MNELILWTVILALCAVVLYQRRWIGKWRRRVWGALELFERWHQHAEDTDKDTIQWKVDKEYYRSGVVPKGKPQ